MGIDENFTLLNGTHLTSFKIMRRTLIIFICISAVAIAAVGQESPFAPFTAAVKEERGGFAGNKENLSKVFNEIRRRLGDRFESELWKYLETDPEKHFWIGSFLSSKSYLHGNDPMPELSTRIRSKTLELLEKRNDNRSLGRKVTINRHLAVSSKLAGRQQDAIRYQSEAERIFAKNEDLSAYVSGRIAYDVCVYDNLAGNIDKCDPDPPPTAKIISAGWMNGRAINYVNPEYPSGVKGLRRAARVDVRILTDENGSVVFADVIRGPQEFHRAAIDAAKRLTFSPTQLSGVPTKVSGWVSYEFYP